MSLKVSALLDGQLEPAEVRPTLEELAADAALRDRYTLYGLVGDALRANPTPDDGFSIRIFERMKREAVKVEPGFDPLKG
ncbi:MAG TPA: sigma-E factor negative regulatory protein [Burkholderiales bacterium]|nr:sigma-E factor negative regulatory protein [Burkholderiales bacterium]